MVLAMSEKQQIIKKIEIVQITSKIGKKIDQQRTLVGLGLGKINQRRVLDYTPSVRGMVEKVKHLVKYKLVS